MWDDFIARQIRRTNRNLFLLGTVLVAIIGTILGIERRAAYNFVLGPFPIQASELSGIWNPDVPKRYFLKVQGEKSIPTGTQEVDQNDHSHVRAEVVALVVGKRLLLVKTPKDNRQLQFAGAIVPIPAEVQSGVVRDTEAKYPQMKGVFLPYMLDATGFRDRDSIFAAIAVAVFGGLGLLLMGISIFRQSNPDKHPLLAKLQRYGQVQDIRMQIDSELRSEGGGERFGALRFTTNWVIQALAYQTNVMQVREVLWAFPKVTKHYHNGIPTGKTYSATLRDSCGQSLEVSGKKDTVPVLLQTLQRRMPWILVGYSKELDALWQKEKPKFFQLMEKRRAELSMAPR